MKAMVDSEEKYIYMLSIDDVEKSVKRLKLGKSGGEAGQSSDHIINSPHILTIIVKTTIWGHKKWSYMAGGLLLEVQIYRNVCPCSN